VPSKIGGLLTNHPSLSTLQENIFHGAQPKQNMVASLMSIEIMALRKHMSYTMSGHQ